MIKTMNDKTQGIFSVQEERRVVERRSDSEDSGAWAIFCDIWNRVAYRRGKGSERRIV